VSLIFHGRRWSRSPLSFTRSHCPYIIGGIQSVADVGFDVFHQAVEHKTSILSNIGVDTKPGLMVSDERL